MERETRVELATSTLARSRSTTELLPLKLSFYSTRALADNSSASPVRQPPQRQQKSARLNMMGYCAFYDGETRRGSDGNRRLRGVGNQGVGRLARLCSFPRRPQPGRSPAAAIGAARAQ